VGGGVVRSMQKELEVVDEDLSVNVARSGIVKDLES
jgi:hypothetical protein